MEILTIPDVHARIYWKNLVNEWKGKIIFLGDYCDPYPDENPLIRENPLDTLKEIISLKKEKPNDITLLLGNHDGHYIWDQYTTSTRYDRFLARDIFELFKNNEDLFKVIRVIDDTIFSHAGITNWWYERMLDILKYPNETTLLDFTKKFENIPIKEYTYAIIENLGLVSRYRGGYYETGSCMWADAVEHYNSIQKNGVTYENCYQIFGHTRIKRPFISESWACLDCSKGFIVNTETHEIKEYDS